MEHSAAILSRSWSDLQISVRVSPQKWNAGHEIFRINGFSRARKFGFAHESDARRKFRAGYFPAYGRRSDSYLRIVAQTFCFSRFTAGHHEETSILFAEPDWSVDGSSVLAEGCQADVALATNLRGN